MRAVAVASPVLKLPEFPLADVISEYLSALKVAGRSPKTISWYADMLWEFVRFIERDGGRATVADPKTGRLAKAQACVEQEQHDRAVALGLLRAGIEGS